MPGTICGADASDASGVDASTTAEAFGGGGGGAGGATGGGVTVAAGGSDPPQANANSASRTNERAFISTRRLPPLDMDPF
jgi:hypothetical protein